MASFSKACLAILRKEDPNASDKSIKERLGRIMQFYSGKSNFPVGLSNDMKIFVSKMSQKRKLAIKQKAYQDLVNKRVKRGFDNYLEAFDPNDFHEAIVSYLVGANPLKLKKSGFFTPGSRKSIFATGDALYKQFRGNMERRLHTDMADNVLFDIFKNSEKDDEILKGVYEEYFSRKPGANKIKSKVSKESQAIAKILMDIKGDVNRRYAKLGAVIDPHPSNMLKLGSHDQAKIPENFNEWLKEVEPMFHDDMFKDIVDKTAYLKQLHRDLRSGKYIKQDISQDNIDLTAGYSSNVNIANKVSNVNRVIFKDAESHIKYMDRFSSSGRHLSESFVFGLEYDARSLALMEALGPNPKNMLVNIIRDVQRKLQLKNPEILNRDFNLNNEGLTPFISARFKELDGTTRQVTNMQLANYSSLARQVKVMSLMGKGVLRSVTDLQTILSEARFQGIPIGSAIDGMVRNFFGGGISQLDKESAHVMGVGLESSIADLMSRIGLGTSLTGNASRLSRTYFRVNLMTWWNDSLKVMAHSIMSHDLGNNAHLSFDNLSFEKKRLLGLFNIDKSDWNLIKSTVTNIDGVKRITSDQIRNLSDKTISQHLFKFDPNIRKRVEDLGASLVNPSAKSRNLAASGIEAELAARKLTREGVKVLTDKDIEALVGKNTIANFRDKLESKVATMFIDRNDSFITVPGAREKAIIHQGTQRGTKMGEFLRFVGTFKTFPLTIGLRPGSTLIANALQRKRPTDFFALAEFIAGMTVLGYVGQSAIDVFEGKKPRDFTDIGTITDAMIKGGAFAIYGDFILGQYADPELFDTLKQAAGPVLSSFVDINEVVASAIAGEDRGRQAYSLLLSWTPFSNLFYTKAALDAAIFKNLQEWFDPGSLRKQERSLKKRTGQDFFIRPSSVVKRGGGNPLENLSRLGKEIVK